MRKIFLTLAVVMVVSFVALGDIPRPPVTPTPKPAKEGKAIDTILYIKLVNSDTAKIKIPKSSLSKLRAELENLENGDDSTAATTFIDGGSGNIQSIVGAAFLSLAIIVGGLWFSRSRSSKAVKTTVAGALLFVSGVATTAVVANIGPPIDTQSITNKIFSSSVQSRGAASGRVKLVVVDDKDSDSVVLEVPRLKGPGEEE